MMKINPMTISGRASQKIHPLRPGFVSAAAFAAVLWICCASISAFGQTVLTPHTVNLKNRQNFVLNLPADLEIIPAAEGLGRVRFFAAAPDGRIFVTGMHDLTDNRKGKVFILDDFDGQSGKFGSVTEYMTGLRNPNSIAFYRDGEGQDWFYLAETDKLTRRRFRPGETEPTDPKPQTVATFPDYGLSYKYGGWHLTRTVVIGGNGKLYVSVGSSCNSCVEKSSEKSRAAVLEMNPDGTGQRVFAKGLRNAVGLRWMGNHLWATNQGADHLGKLKPDETFYSLRNGFDYGWPYCYQAGGRIFRDPNLRRSGGCRGVPVSYAYFPAHSSALGFEYFDSTTTSELFRDSFVVALHGSTDKEVGSGYKIVIMRKGKKPRDFLTGFLERGTVYGRPCDIFKLTADSFLVSDDHSGVVYYVRKKLATAQRVTPDFTDSLDRRDPVDLLSNL